MTTHIDLSKLPEPNIIESLSFEDIYQARKARFISLAPEFSQALELESDPLNVWLQVESYQELLLRQRINEAAQSNLLAFAKSADLEHLGAFYGVERIAGELDDDYRTRIRNNTIASSTAGSAEHYRNHAINAAPSDISDVSVFSPGNGEVIITVLAKAPSNAEATLEKVTTAVTDDGVKMLTDKLEVNLAHLVEIDITADIYLQDDTSQSVFDELESALREAWQQQAHLQWDLAPSWVAAQLHKKGVRHVDIQSPSGLQKMSHAQCAVPGNITLTLRS
ncbi:MULTISPECIES: baseplate assembly protein [Pseudoalteromonas]|uniref:Baseplate assembly protein n=1 Tax=Pseudoalteromonas amylolytica TaxID=1859457 RepID=A0A1S1MYL8_9GAMM|nr:MULTISPECIES: baseplate J/gp47 family protein [Pseudoalteromonas]OHU87824.1 baseplate assembly protein [Pseudoalteromonas sp. JW3]OHU91264.1 baseplate assembly protein [Pseudoalteromonas amylolytica]